MSYAVDAVCLCTPKIFKYYGKMWPKYSNNRIRGVSEISKTKWYKAVSFTIDL